MLPTVVRDMKRQWHDEKMEKVFFAHNLTVWMSSACNYSMAILNHRLNWAQSLFFSFHFSILEWMTSIFLCFAIFFNFFNFFNFFYFFCNFSNFLRYFLFFAIFFSFFLSNSLSLSFSIYLYRSMSNVLSLPHVLSLSLSFTFSTHFSSLCF